jgi:hypothetical protein
LLALKDGNILITFDKSSVEVILSAGTNVDRKGWKKNFMKILSFVIVTENRKRVLNRERLGEQNI